MIPQEKSRFNFLNCQINLIFEQLNGLIINKIQYKQRQSKNLDQTGSSDQPDQTCYHGILKDTWPFFSKLGNNTETNMFILKIQESV